MPWTCTNCHTELADYQTVCPECSQAKTNWTVIQDRTRTFVVPAKRSFDLRRGQRTQPAGPDDPEGAVSLVPVSRISAIEKQEVRGWFEAGQHPPSGYVVFVVLYPRGSSDLQVTLEVLYAGRPSEELTFSPEAPADLARDAAVYVPFLFVRGEGDLEGVQFAGTRLVDLSEDTREGFAPSVELAALGRPAQELPVIPNKRKHLVWSF